MNTPSRRAVLGAGLGVAATGALAACSSSHAGGMAGMSGSSPGSSDSSGSSGALVSPSGPEVEAADRKRTRTGRTTTVKLTAASGVIDLGGPMVKSWAFNGQLPLQPIRISAGDTLVAQLANHLSQPTSIHWHGVALRNDMDGVPPITQRAVAAGSSFTYRFTTDAPGTYWFHPHVGVQQDRGLYGALIVEDPHETLKYDDEWVVVLDDWLDGVDGATPDSVYAQLRKGMGGMSGMDMGSMSSPSGRGAGDVKYPYYLVNGRVPEAPDVYIGKPGHRLRIRMINAGGDTAFRVALGGHKLTITHTDGYPVEHQQVDAVLLGPGERYDLLVTLADGVFPLTALAEGKNAAARALVRTGSGGTPPASARPKELDGVIMASTQLRAAEGDRLAARSVDVVHRIELTGGMRSYNWSLNGRKFDMNNAAANPFTTPQGQRVRLEFINNTMMWHPMHLHGHTFQLGPSGPRKDTVIVLPGKTVTCDLDAENPGQWLLHCHNVYHGEAGMMGLFGYLA